MTEDIKKGGDETIHITDKDLGPKETSSLTRTITIKIGDEDLKVDVSPDVTVGWQDILASELESMVDIKEPVNQTDQTEYHFSVLSSLRDDIKRGKTEGKNDRDIFVGLATRYHPDLYETARPDVKDLATEYSQALGTLRKVGEIKP